MGHTLLNPATDQFWHKLLKCSTSTDSDLVKATSYFSLNVPGNQDRLESNNREAPATRGAGHGQEDREEKQGMGGVGHQLLR